MAAGAAALCMPVEAAGANTALTRRAQRPCDGAPVDAVAASGEGGEGAEIGKNVAV